MMGKALIIALAIASCTIGQGTNNSIIDASDSQSVDKMKSDETKKSEQMVPKDVKTDNSGSKNQVGEDKQRQMTKEKEKPKDDGKQKNHNTPNIVNPKVIVLKASFSCIKKYQQTEILIYFAVLNNILSLISSTEP